MGTPSNAILEVESELVQRMIFQTLPLERRRGDRREYHWDQLRARHAEAVVELGGHSPLTSTAHDFVPRAGRRSSGSSRNAVVVAAERDWAPETPHAPTRLRLL